MNIFIENKGCQFFLHKRTNNVEVKTKLPAEKTIEPRTSQDTLSFYDWLVSILNSLHASVCFDRLDFCVRFQVDQMIRQNTRFSFFHCSCFCNFFLIETNRFKQFHTPGKIQKKDLSPNCKSNLLAFRQKASLQVIGARFISNSNNLVQRSFCICCKY